MQQHEITFTPGDSPIHLVHEQLSRAGAGSTLTGTAVMRRGQQVPAEGESAHPADEYSFVLRGQVEIEIGGVVHKGQPGTFMFIPAGEGHITRALEDSEVLWWWVGQPQDFTALKEMYPAHNLTHNLDNPNNTGEAQL